MLNWLWIHTDEVMDQQQRLEEHTKSYCLDDWKCETNVSCTYLLIISIFVHLIPLVLSHSPHDQGWTNSHRDHQIHLAHTHSNRHQQKTVIARGDFPTLARGPKFHECFLLFVNRPANRSATARFRTSLMKANLNCQASQAWNKPWPPQLSGHSVVSKQSTTNCYFASGRNF